MLPYQTQIEIKAFIQKGDKQHVEQFVKKFGVNRNIGQYEDNDLSALVYTAGLAILKWESYEKDVHPLDKERAKTIMKMLVEKGAKDDNIVGQCKSFQSEVNSNSRDFFVDDEMVLEMIQMVNSVLLKR